jgi:hypothetical protein
MGEVRSGRPLNQDLFCRPHAICKPAVFALPGGSLQKKGSTWCPWKCFYLGAKVEQTLGMEISVTKATWSAGTQHWEVQRTVQPSSKEGII